MIFLSLYSITIYKFGKVLVSFHCTGKKYTSNMILEIGFPSSFNTQMLWRIDFLTWKLSNYFFPFNQCVLNIWTWWCFFTSLKGPNGGIKMQNNKITILWGATGILEGTIKKLWGFQSNFFIDIKLKKFPKLYGPKYVKNIS